MLKKTERLNADKIKAVFATSKATHSPIFSLRYTSTHATNSRFACVVSKKVAAKAVDRSTIRRQVRVLAASYGKLFKKPVDCVISVNKALPKEAKERQIVFEGILKQAHLI